MPADASTVIVPPCVAPGMGGAGAVTFGSMAAPALPPGPAMEDSPGVVLLEGLDGEELPQAARASNAAAETAARDLFSRIRDSL